MSPPRVGSPGAAPSVIRCAPEPSSAATEITDGHGFGTLVSAYSEQSFSAVTITPAACAGAAPNRSADVASRAARNTAATLL